MQELNRWCTDSERKQSAVLVTHQSKASTYIVTEVYGIASLFVALAAYNVAHAGFGGHASPGWDCRGDRNVSVDELQPGRPVGYVAVGWQDLLRVRQGLRYHGLSGAIFPQNLLHFVYL